LKRRRSIRVANGIEAEVEAIGELPLGLNNDFIVRLRNTLYVPSLTRNLISVSCLDDDGYDYQFGNLSEIMALSFRPYFKGED
jgi:hypothetical protein